MSSDIYLKLDNEIIKNRFIIQEKNLMIWPLIRWKILSNINTKKYNLKTAHAVSIKKISINSLKYIYDTLKYAPHIMKKNYQIIFYNTARDRVNNKNFNTYSDYYTSLPYKTINIQSSYRNRYYIPNNTNDFAVGEYGKLKAYIINRIKSLFYKTHIYEIERFINYIKTKDYIDNEFAQKIRKELNKYYNRFDYYKSYILKVFRRLDPRLIVVRTAAYGELNGILIKVAKENGIKTAEFQHGVISENHMAYNYGESIFQSKEYKKYLPEYILTYGDYWKNNITIPSKKITIGNPHFYESIKKYKNIKEQKNSILIMSQGTITHKFVNIAKYLSEKLQNYRIVFKLHPGEVPFESRYNELYKYTNIDLAKSGDIYHYIAQCENIIACYSTTIFESLGFKKNLFILDNELSKKNIPKDIGLRFKEKTELIDLILNNKAPEMNYNLEYYFNSKWEENYKKFLSEEVGINNLFNS